ncbi:MAG: GntR family transcriptional regulator [Synergistaceae bacterium]|jgi:DNA-binding GntR family transcriptional regulator|nr:GntR family transcriptional regulator [Synergistaceae bacterium]
MGKIRMEIQSVGEIICNEIRHRILEGLCASGERLNVDELARTLDASKTPVREALGRLESEGLVVFKPRVGWSVSALTMEEFADLLEIQYALRLFISDNLLPYIDKLDFDYLESVNRKLQNLLKGQDYFQIVQQNDLFHMTIFSIHSNQAMVRRLKELDGLIRLQRVRFFEQEKTFFPAIAENAFIQHQNILEKLKSRDADTISRVSREHFASIVGAYKHLSRNMRENVV